MPNIGVTIASGLLVDQDCDIDAVMPIQYLAQTRGHNGIRDLARAVLTQAIMDYVAVCHCRTNTSRNKRPCWHSTRRADTVRFFLQQDNSSYQWVCDALGLDPTWLWEHVRPMQTFDGPSLHVTKRHRRVNGKRGGRYN